MKIFKVVWLLATLICTTQSYSIQYLYPVAVIDQHVYCVFQSSPEIIALIVWDKEHNEMIPGLLSRYMPAGLCLLPDVSGYSFIDNGILRIKTFAKRSPESIEFYAPIYTINVPEWIDATTGYFAAKVRENFGIFQFDTDGSLAGLLVDSKKDFLYPQKVGGTLFYIERTKRILGYQFRLMHISYPPLAQISMNNDDESVAFTAILEDQTATEMIDFHNEPIAFLRMHNSHTGYLISYPATIDENADHIVCSYYLISKKQEWHEQRLFDFVLPSALLFETSQERLFESILPLLPRHIGNAIYFVDASAGQNLSLNLYAYYPDADAIEQLTNFDAPGEHCFGPIVVGNQLYCGGAGFKNELNFIKLVH